MNCFVVDTNVVLVANGQHENVSPDCIASCALRLQDIMLSGKLALDENFRILSEYQNKTVPKTGNRPGDAFVRWALRNNANTARIDCVLLIEHSERGFDTFPIDADLLNFDPPDRKFVAVARGHPDSPPILQAADSKWLGWNSALKKHGVTVEFLCPDDISRFQANKDIG
jgi:hypothetical protein